MNTRKHRPVQKIVLENKQNQRIIKILQFLVKNEEGLGKNEICTAEKCAEGTINKCLETMAKLGLIEISTAGKKRQTNRYKATKLGVSFVETEVLNPASLMNVRVELTGGFWRQLEKTTSAPDTDNLRNILCQIQNDPKASKDFAEKMADFTLTYIRAFLGAAAFSGQFFSDGRFGIFAAVPKGWADVVQGLINKRLVQDEKEAVSLILYFGWDTLNNALLGVQTQEAKDVTKSITVHGIEIIDGKIRLMEKEKTEMALKKALCG